jgi:hypothetical protein
MMLMVMFFFAPRALSILYATWQYKGLYTSVAYPSISIYTLSASLALTEGIVISGVNTFTLPVVVLVDVAVVPAVPNVPVVDAVVVAVG